MLSTKSQFWRQKINICKKVHNSFNLSSILKHCFSEDLRNSLIIYLNYKNIPKPSIIWSKYFASTTCTTVSTFWIICLIGLARGKKVEMWINILKIKTKFCDVILTWIRIIYGLQEIFSGFHLYSCIFRVSICFFYMTLL